MTPHDCCPDCGAVISGGREGCQAAWETITLRAYSEPAYGVLYDMAFDTYCMQHPEKYCRSTKSYAAHLTRLCCGLEYDGDTKVYAAIRRWLDGRVELEKSQLLAYRGKLTIADLLNAPAPQAYRQRILYWAEDVWAAYGSQHDLARSWIKAAMKSANYAI